MKDHECALGAEAKVLKDWGVAEERVTIESLYGPVRKYIYEIPRDAGFPMMLVVDKDPKLGWYYMEVEKK